jgi:hypothetical protein
MKDHIYNIPNKSEEEELYQKRSSQRWPVFPMYTKENIKFRGIRTKKEEILMELNCLLTLENMQRELVEAARRCSDKVGKPACLHPY